MTHELINHDNTLPLSKCSAKVKKEANQYKGDSKK